MKIGMVGLGKMGMNMARRLLLNGHQVVAFDSSDDKIIKLAKEGAIAASSLQDLTEKLSDQS